MQSQQRESLPKNRNAKHEDAPERQSYQILQWEDGLKTKLIGKPSVSLRN